MSFGMTYRFFYRSILIVLYIKNALNEKIIGHSMFKWSHINNILCYCILDHNSVVLYSVYIEQMSSSKKTFSLLRYLYKKLTSFQLKTKHKNHTIFLSLPGLYLIPLPIRIQKKCYLDVGRPKKMPN